MIKPALRRLYRDPGTIQFGLDPRRALAVELDDLADLALLDLFDGSRDTAALKVAATRCGHQPERVDALIAMLADAGVLADGEGSGTIPPRLAPDAMSLSLMHPTPDAPARVLAVRRHASVAVRGAGRVGATVAGLLAAAGVGTVSVLDADHVRAADICPTGLREPGSTRRGPAVRTIVRSFGAHDVDRSGQRPQLLILAPAAPAVDPQLLAEARDRPHLLAMVQETTGVVGPLVVPGRTPCLRCLELSRGERDPAWPALSAQLLGDPTTASPCDVTLATMTATLAAMHALLWIDRPAVDPPSVGGVVEFGLGDLSMRRRSIRAHPGCGCGAP